MSAELTMRALYWQGRRVEHMTEQRVVCRAVRGLIKAGWLLAVHDGDNEWLQPPAADPAAVINDLFSMDTDTVRVISPAVSGSCSHGRVGPCRSDILLVYGNEADEVLADYTCGCSQAEAAVEAAFAGDHRRIEGPS